MNHIGTKLFFTRSLRRFALGDEARPGAENRWIVAPIAGRRFHEPTAPHPLVEELKKLDTDARATGDKATTTAADGGSGGDSGGGDVDCAAIKKVQTQLLSIQLLAQLKDPARIESIKTTGIGNLDLDEFLAAMKVLHQLDGQTSPLGDPKEAIDIYEQAATDAKALFEADPPAQADIDAYNESIGSTAEFLGHQVAIAGAVDEAGC